MSLWSSGYHRKLGLSDEDVLEMYKQMLLARRLDERMTKLNRQGKVPFTVSVEGHEAVQVAAAAALDTDRDWSFPYYRDGAFVLALGMTPKEILLGLFGKADDPTSGGRQLPNHWSDKSLKIYTQSSVIGPQFPHACGVALALQFQGSDGVVFVSSGEGGTSEGDWHEALNFAGIKSLPVVFLVENNLYAISVPSDEEVSGNIFERGAGYGMPGIRVDGNDLFAVYQAMKDAVQRARAGDGPTLIEAMTYRYYSHTSDDDERIYRSREEVTAWREKDPLPRVREYLLAEGILKEAHDVLMIDSMDKMLAELAKEAEAASDPTDYLSRVYAKDIVPAVPVTAIEGALEGEEVNMITAVNRALHEIFEENPNVVLFGQDVADPKGGVFKTTIGLTDTFGKDRCFNMPIAESLIVGVGIGMSATGMLPIAEMQFADFSHPAFDQIVSEAARIHYRSLGEWNCPLVIRAPYGGGIHGGLYHSQSIEAFYAHIPGLKVVIPSTPADAKGLLWSAVLDPDPVLFLEPKKLYRLAKGPYPAGAYRVPIGQAALRRDGDDLVIIAYGAMAYDALSAADRLAEEGINVSVLDLRSIRPLDWPSIDAAVRRTGKVLIVHEDNEFGGFGAEIAAQIAKKAFDWLDAPVERLAAPEIPAFPFSSPMEKEAMPSVEGIVSRARELAAY